MEKQIQEWHYYNHAIIPSCLPHEIPNLEPLLNGSIWKMGGGIPLLARYTTDFDCGYETNWWYVIKNIPFDISKLKAKRRYEINKGLKNFEVYKLENPVEYREKLYEVAVKAFSAYPAKYRPSINKEAFFNQVNAWQREDCYIYGAFSCEDNRMYGYAQLTQQKQVLHFNILKTVPKSEKNGVNAAIIYRVLMDFNESFHNGFYICDGARNISHETNFQDYLEKYFGFRKAYCKLQLKFNPKYRIGLLLLYRFKKLFKKLDFIGLIHKMNGVFMMYEIVEGQKNE